MNASSWIDPVLGIDMHWEFVPMPAPVPIPFPHPFIGIVVDVAGLAGAMLMNGAMSLVFGAPFKGPVLYWGVFPATNTGTNAKHIPGHFIIPPGTAWAPVPRTPKPKIHPGDKSVPAAPIKPENDAVCITGSKTVYVGGTNAVRLLDIALSCSEPVRLPSSVVLAIPKGAPIVIGGPMALDLMAAILASLRTRFVSDSLHALMSHIPFKRVRDLMQKAVCLFTGHPVDVASGRVVTSGLDAELPGPMPLKIERSYSSSFAERPGPLGRGWSISLDQSIWLERGKVVLLEEDGREIEFDTFDFPQHRMSPGDQVWYPIDRLTLKCLANHCWQVVAHDGATRDFAPVPGRNDGRAMIRRVRSRCGNHETLFEYDKAGRLEWVQDACGRILHLERDDEGRFTELKLPLPSGQGWYVHRRYTYDADGDLVQVTDPLNHTWRFEYFTHLLVRETDRTGLSFYFEYDGLGQDAWCTRTWGDGGIYDHKIAYDKKNKITFVTNSLGTTTQYHMNVIGQVVKVVNPLGGESCYEYDPHTLQKTAEVDPLGNTKRWEYDRWGNCTKTIEPDGAEVTAEYDARNNVLRAVNASRGEWRWDYLAPGLLKLQSDPHRAVTEYHSQRGLLTSLVNPTGGRTTVEYDERKTIALVRDPDGAETRLWSDALGRVVRALLPGGGEKQLKYDSEGRPVEVKEPDGNLRRLSYDPEGNLLTYLDAAREVKYAYTGYHWPAREERAGETLRLDYDSEGRLTCVTNELGERHRFVLDECGRLSQEIGFDGGVWRYDRDKAGRVVTETRPSGATAKVAYDASGRVTAVEYSDGTRQEFGYGPDGSLIRAQNESSRVEIERDELGQVIREIQGEHFVTSHYDAAGLRQTVESSLHVRQSMLWSAGGQLQRLMMVGPRVDSWEVEFSRDAAGAEIESRFPGGVTATWERDVAARPKSQQVRTASRVLTHRQYEWGPELQLRRATDAARGGTQYTHDPRGRLVKAEYPSGQVQYRMPDATGNLYRTQQRHDRQYGPGGRLDAVDGTTYRHDADGKLVEKRGPDGSVWQYRWSGAGLLKEVTRPDGEKVEFEYDALGRRVSKRTPRSEVRWVWDRNVPLHELSSREGPTTWFFDAAGVVPLGKEQGGARFAVVTDQIGTPTELYDEAGQLAWQMQLDSYGVGKPDVAQTSCPWRWPGQYEDEETGLYYNRFRYYDPESGGYISPDPIGFAGGTAPYAYAPDPLTWIDLLGLVSGIYEFLEGAKTYIGMSNDTGRRLTEHGSRVSSVVSETAVDTFGAVGRDARRLRRLAEQEAIDAAKAAGKDLSNIDRAVAENKMGPLKALRDWYEGGQKGDKPKCS